MNYKILLTAALFTVFLSTSVLAVPPRPHQFWGTVTINGNPASDGTTVTAKVDGVEVESTTTYAGNGTYSMIVKNQDPGDIVNFFVEGIDTGKTSSILVGGVDRLDLSATIDEGGSSGGGSPGGGSSGAGEETTTTIEETSGSDTEQGEDICREKWTCTDWSACVDGKQTRTCTEENDCGTDLYKPFEEQPCVEEEGTQAGGLDLGATGRFLTSPVGIGSMVVVILAIAGAVFFWKRKGLKPAKSSTERSE